MMGKERADGKHNYSEYLIIILGGFESEVAQHIKAHLDDKGYYCEVELCFLRTDTQFANVRDGIKLGTAGAGQAILRTNAPPSIILHMRFIQAALALIAVEPHLYTPDISAKDGGAPEKETLDKIEVLIAESKKWTQALKLWEQCMVLAGKHSIPEKVAAGRLRFRASAVRDGRHGFQSPAAAGAAGAGVAALRPGWRVDLEAYDLELLLVVWNNQVAAGLVLNPLNPACGSGLPTERRPPLAALGRPTTLRPSTAHLLLALARPRPGDVVVDNMCGVGTIPLEAAAAWGGALCGLGGEREPACVAEIEGNLRPECSSSRHKIEKINRTSRKAFITPQLPVVLGGPCVEHKNNQSKVVIVIYSLNTGNATKYKQNRH